MRYLSICIMLTVFSACGGINREVPDFVGVVDGDPCGPCDSFVVVDGQCNLKELASFIEETDTCDALLFVDPTKMESGDGTKNNPYNSMTQAQSIASNGKAKVIMVASDAMISGPLEIQDAVHVLGGYEPGTFIVNESIRPTFVSSQTGTHAYGLIARGITKKTTIKSINIVSDGQATHKIGLHAVNASNLFLEDITITAASGLDGEDGLEGKKGTDGPQGGDAGMMGNDIPGKGAINEDCPTANGGEGGRGGAKTQDGVRAAERGKASPAGSSGGQFGQDVPTAQNGEDGQNAMLPPSGRIEDETWYIQPGQSGEPGRPGQGAGGGAGGDHQNDGIGGGGGGGGAGGCGGEGGKPGQPGGVSIGALLINSTISMLNVTINASDGGRGGVGGVGGLGGFGGGGGRSADGTNSALPGKPGGIAGNGGQGGQGSPGAGGLSVALYCDEASKLEQNTNIILVPGNAGVFGDGVTMAKREKQIGCN